VLLVGFRLVEKYAMMVGGVDTHRLDLSAMLMLKDNHIAALGDSLFETNMLSDIKKAAGFTRKIAVEVHSEELYAKMQGLEVVDILLLDHFTPEAIQRCVRRYGKSSIIETSGGIRLAQVASYMLDCNI
jgi:nicotinate-nucleotide pyrophosphorylase (carboxylating)